MTQKRLLFIFVFILFILFTPAYAKVIITEIMYDVSGSDAGREWVEIQNTGAPIDLTGWKFFENGVNHGLTLAHGNIFLPQNGFAIIADNAEKFLLDSPNFLGTLFDSSFSLSNTGETIALRDAGFADSDSVTYFSNSGAAGNGNSLQKNSNGWISGLSTPGSEYTEKIDENNTLKPQQGVEAVGFGSIPEPKSAPFSAYAGEDKLALAGAEVYFEGYVEGIAEDLISKSRFLWNFGDGTIGEGKNIKHIFQYPGNYIANLNVSFGVYSASDFVKIAVSSAGIVVSEIKPGVFLEIKNDSSKIADVSGFGIQINNSKIFNFPKDTKLTAGSFLTLDSLILGFEIPNVGEIKILYPNGKILFSSKYNSGILSENESINFEKDLWVKGKETPGTEIIVKKPLSAAADSSKVNIQDYTTSVKSISKNSKKETQSKYLKVASKEASVVKSQASSFWSEIKWLIFGLGGGVFIGLFYIFIKYKMTKNQTTI